MRRLVTTRGATPLMRALAGLPLAGLLVVVGGCQLHDTPEPAPTREETFAEIRQLLPDIHFPKHGVYSEPLYKACDRLRDLAGLHFGDVTQLTHDEAAQLLEAALSCEGGPDTARQLLRDLLAGQPNRWTGPLDPAIGRDD